MKIASRASTALVLVLAAPLAARTTGQATAPVAGMPAAPAASSWQSAGSDLPADPAWRTGTLPNGLRYAVRRGQRPPGSISVRIRIEAGGLMETDEQQGWSHLLEHMVFRGTKDFADGEGVKVWQRLGASFGTDSNAFTGLTATTYVLDLPRNDEASYAQAMAVLSEMMGSATIDPAALETERKVVLAERALRLPPIAQKVQAVANPIMLAGTKAAQRNIIGSEATLSAASADRLRAYYKAWYRPSRAQVIVVGDADPAMLEAQVRRHFGGWRAVGAEPAAPDFGAPTKPPRDSAAVVDPQLPNGIQMAYVTPHDERPWTIARQQRQYQDWVALGVLNQRLSTEAQKGGAMIGGQLSLNASRHIQDQLTLSLGFKPGNWKAAFDQAAGVLNGALAAPPSQEEIDTQVKQIASNLDRQVAEESTASSPGLANGYVNDVDQGDVSSPNTFYRDLFAAQRKSFDPASVQATIRRLFAPEPRLMVYSSVPVTGGDAAVATALTGVRKVAAVREASIRVVSMDELKLPGTPATVTSTSTIPDLGIERVRFSNGVELDLKQTDFEKDRIRVDVRIGHGLLGEARSDPGLSWTSNMVMGSGFGPFRPDELTRLLAGRNIGFRAGLGLDALSVDGASDRQNIADMLKLMAVGVSQNQYRPVTVSRLRDSMIASYQATYSQPSSVMSAFSGAYFYGGDTRFRGLPSLNEISALTLPAFRSYWEPRLAAGPIQIVVVGDFDRAAVIDAVARSFGTLPPRKDVPLDPGHVDVRATLPAASPITLFHKGDAGQAMVVRAWPTLGVLDDTTTVRALDVAAQIIETRLLEGFREKQGGSYSPFASHPGYIAMPHYGLLQVGAQLGVGRIEDFEKTLSAIMADLATNGPKPDEFARAKSTILGNAQRARSNNAYWISVLGNDFDDARILTLIRQGIPSREAVTIYQVRDALARFAGPSRPGFEIRVLPEASSLPPSSPPPPPPPSSVRSTQSD